MSAGTGRSLQRSGYAQRLWCLVSNRWRAVYRLLRPGRRSDRLRRAVDHGLCLGDRCERARRDRSDSRWLARSRRAILSVQPGPIVDAGVKVWLVWKLIESVVRVLSLMRTKQYESGVHLCNESRSIPSLAWKGTVRSKSS